MGMTGDASQIGLFEAIYTQRAIRRFKQDPVPSEMIEKLVEAASKAPSGGNSQPWAFIAVDDQERKTKLAELVREQFEPMYQTMLSRRKPGDPPPMPNFKRLVEEYDSVPVWILVCVVLPPGMDASNGAAMSGSVFPAIQNLLLAARGLGLGAAMTGPHSNVEKVRELFGIPANVIPLANIPIGYPDHDHYGPTTRRPVSEILHRNGWELNKANTAALAHR
jgi:nitroreductase